MNLEQLYNEAKKELASLPSGVSRYDTIRQAHSALISYDIQGLDKLLNESAQKPGSVFADCIEQVDNAVQEALEHRRAFEAVRKNYGQLSLSKGAALCELIAERAVKYGNMLQEKTSEIYAEFEQEQKSLKKRYEHEKRELESNGRIKEPKVKSIRAKIDSLEKKHHKMDGVCAQRGINTDAAHKKNISGYVDKKQDFELLQGKNNQISSKISKISWNSAYQAELNQMYKDNFKKGLFSRKTQITDCEKAEFYEGALEAMGLDSSLKQLLDKWDSLESCNSKLKIYLKKAKDAVSTLQQMSVKTGYFNELRGFVLPSAREFEIIRDYTAEVEEYARQLNIFEKEKKEKAAELAKDLVRKQKDPIIDALNSDNFGELETAKKTAEQLSRDLVVLAYFVDVSKYQTCCKNHIAGISERMDYLKQEREKQHEIEKKKIENDETVKRTQNDLQKERKEREKEKEASSKRTAAWRHKTRSLSSSLIETQKQSEEKQKTIDGLLLQWSELYELIQNIAVDNRNEINELVTGKMEYIEKTLRDYNDQYRALNGEINQLKNQFQKIPADLRSQYGALDKKVDSLAQAFKSAPSVDLSGVYSDLKGIKDKVLELQSAGNKKQNPVVDLSGIQAELNALNSKISNMPQLKIVKSSRLENIEQTLGYIKLELEGIKNRKPEVVEVVKHVAKPTAEYNCQIMFELEELEHPDNSDLRYIRRKLTDTNGGSSTCLIEKISELKDDFACAQPIDSIFDLDWVKKVKYILKEDMKSGLIAFYTNGGGYGREQFYEVLAVIDNFIKKSQVLVDAKLAALVA